MSTDEEPEAPLADEEPATESDIEVPEADALDQARDVAPHRERGHVSDAIDAPEADAIDQATEVPLDEDEER